MQSLTIVVPIHNESRTIPKLINLLVSLYESTKFSCIFVDDGSIDDSLSLLNLSLKDVVFKYRIISQENLGKAGAIHEAAKYIESSHTVILDADLEIDPDAVRTAWQIVSQGTYQSVLGYREFRSHSSFTYRFSRGNQLISNAYGILFNSLITDVMCGFKMVPSVVIKNLPLSLSGFAIEIEILGALWMNHIQSYELKIEYYPRTRQDGKSITVLDALKVLFLMLWLRVRIKQM